MRTSQIIILVIGLCFLSYAIFSVVKYHDVTIENKEVPCYDRYGREMVGEVCIKEIDKFNDNFGLGIVGFMLCMVLLQILEKKQLK